MRKSNFFLNSLLSGAMALAVAACSSEELADMSAATTDSDGPQAITLKIKTPGADDVIFSGALARRVQSAAVSQTSDEWAINTLNVYLFDKADDGSYKYLSTVVFSPSNPTLLLQQTTGTDAAYTCALPITEDLTGKTVKMVLLANDAGSITPTEGTTTIEEFKKTLATAAIATDGTGTADDLVSTGFPMAAVATTSSDQSEEITISSEESVAVEASLVRSVARIDVENNTPNLTVTGVKLLNVANKSYMFAQNDDSSPSAPTSESDYQLVDIGAMNDWSTAFATGVAYDATNTDANALAGVVYMYEQAAATVYDECPVVQISYTVDFDNGDSYDRTIDVAFIKEGDDGAYEYLSVTRNHLYRVVLGDGNEIDGSVAAPTVTVEDWSEGDLEGSNSILLNIYQ